MSEEIQGDEYRCSMCKGIFKSGWTDEEAKAEAEANGFNPDTCAVICDDCYKEVMQ